jgi:transcriptional regulator with XRE-family HTH domain
METLVPFGEFIKMHRQLAGYSGQELASKVECSGSFITGIERGKQFPSAIMASKILNALGIEHKKVTPTEIATDSYTFHFKSSLRGRSKERTRDLNNREIETKLVALENEVNLLRKIVISLLAKGIGED